MRKLKPTHTTTFSCETNTIHAPFSVLFFEAFFFFQLLSFSLWFKNKRNCRDPSSTFCVVLEVLFHILAENHGLIFYPFSDFSAFFLIPSWSETLLFCLHSSTITKLVFFFLNIEVGGILHLFTLCVQKKNMATTTTVGGLKRKSPPDDVCSDVDLSISFQVYTWFFNFSKMILFVLFYFLFLNHCWISLVIDNG